MLSYLLRTATLTFGLSYSVLTLANDSVDQLVSRVKALHANQDPVVRYETQLRAGQANILGWDTDGNKTADVYGWYLVAEAHNADGKQPDPLIVVSDPTEDGMQIVGSQDIVGVRLQQYPLKYIRLKKIPKLGHPIGKTIRGA